MKIYQGARIFNGDRLLNGFSLVIKDNKVLELIPDHALPESADIIKLNGGIISTGFIDIQVNGGGGVLFNNDISAEGLATIFEAHHKYGGTAFMLPTFITDEQSKMHKAIKLIAEAVKNNYQGIVGGHFEGPFINPNKNGTHNPKFIRTPKEEDFSIFANNADYLQNSLLTLAPECLEKNTISRFKSYIPQIAAGHTMATFQDLELAYCEGLNGITHLYNAMADFRGREPAIIGSAGDLGLFVSIIPDGVHSNPHSLANAYRSIGAERLILITDAMLNVGAPTIKDFDLMGIKVFVKDDCCRNEFGALAAANITMLDALKNAIKFMNCSIEDALKMAITNPAKFIKREDLSFIVGRKIEQIIYLDETLNLREFL